MEEIVVACFHERAHYDATCLRQAMRGAGTSDAVLVEILLTRTQIELLALIEAYAELFHRSLEADVISECSGDYKRLLVSTLQCCRPSDSLPVSIPEAIADATALQAAGAGKWGTDESKFNEILSTRSYAHIREMNLQYSILAGRDLVSVIRKEMSGTLQTAFTAVVLSAVNRTAFFASSLRKAMHGAGTDDTTLIRIVVTRCEVDMVEIKEAYLEEHHKTLGHSITSEVGGNYKHMLLGLIGDA
jgi:Annexin